MEKGSSNIDKLRSYANIFTNSTFERLIRSDDFSHIQARIKKYDNGFIRNGRRTYREYFSHSYKALIAHYRNEYIYKNFIIEQILIGKYSLKTTNGLNEFRINKSIADLVLVNGTSKVFEIKTELDNPNRLANQINDYKKVFKEIYIVTHHSLEHKYNEIISNDIGLIVLTSNNTLKTIREPLVNDNLDSITMMKCLRKFEYSNIILSYYGSIPNSSDFKFYSTCKVLFEKIPIYDLHYLMINELKKRTIKEKDILVSKIVPKELKHICMCLNFNKEEYKKLDKLLSEIIL